MRPRRWRICCVWRGRVRSHQVRFADVPLSDVSYPRRFEEAGLVFVSVISTSAPARVRYLVRRISTARAGRESFGRPVGIVTGRARRRESGAWRLGRYRHERTRCPCRGARSSQQIRFPGRCSSQPVRARRCRRMLITGFSAHPCVRRPRTQFQWGSKCPLRRQIFITFTPAIIRILGSIHQQTQRGSSTR